MCGLGCYRVSCNALRCRRRAEVTGGNAARVSARFGSPSLAARSLAGRFAVQDSHDCRQAPIYTPTQPALRGSGGGSALMDAFWGVTGWVGPVREPGARGKPEGRVVQLDNAFSSLASSVHVWDWSPKLRLATKGVFFKAYFFSKYFRVFKVF